MGKKLSQMSRSGRCADNLRNQLLISHWLVQWQYLCRYPPLPPSDLHYWKCYSPALPNSFRPGMNNQKQWHFYPGAHNNAVMSSIVTTGYHDEWWQRFDLLGHTQLNATRCLLGQLQRDFASRLRVCMSVASALPVIFTELVYPPMGGP